MADFFNIALQLGAQAFDLVLRLQALVGDVDCRKYRSLLDGKVGVLVRVLDLGVDKLGDFIISSLDAPLPGGAFCPILLLFSSIPQIPLFCILFLTSRAFF